jgi:HlyD family secretion protein
MTDGTHASNDDYRQLDSFAQKRLQAAEPSELIQKVPFLVERGGIYLIAAALVVTLGFLYFGKTGIVVTATGKILPEGDVIGVQTTEAGVVNAVLARAGDRLEAGTPILKLDVSESGINLAELKSKRQLQVTQLQDEREAIAEIDRILADPNRLTHDGRALAPAGNALPLISALENARLKLESARADLAALPDRRQLQAREIDLVRERVRLLRSNLTNDQAALQGQEAALAQKREHLQNIRRLAEEKLISAVELNAEEEKFRNAQSDVTAARQRLGEQSIEISNQQLRESEIAAKLLSAQSEAQSNLRTAQMAYDQAVTALRRERENLRIHGQELESTLDTARRRVEVAENRMALASVSMPATGTISELKVRNAGELVAAGAVVATVVPEGVPLTVEAEVSNKDVGFVKAGLPAQVKVDAYPFQQFGTVSAEVMRVLPSSANTNFVIKLRLLERRLQTSGDNIFLLPGLTVKADLLTSRRRLLDVLLRGDSKTQSKTR